jgi:hypothetical protein
MERMEWSIIPRITVLELSRIETPQWGDSKLM